MADTLKLSADAPDVSDSEVSSLCGSELELEMAWGEGPIAPLRTDAVADDGVNKNAVASAERPNSNGNGSSRARTPQKRGSDSPLARSKRLINIHPIRSAGYLSKPNELPLGQRKQQRWFNVHIIPVVGGLVSNFQKLAEPQNEELQTAFRKGRGAHVGNGSNQLRYRRKDEWNGTVTGQPLVVVYVGHEQTDFHATLWRADGIVWQWREVPSELEVAAPLFRMLQHPIELLRVSEKDVRLVFPLLDSAFHRLIIHSVCQFYGVRSRTEANRRLNTKIMVLKSPKKKFSADELTNNSLCEFIRETRITKRSAATLSPEKNEQGHALEVQSKSSECSDGFCMVESPQL
ncbi:hypothetical protein BBJ28_00009595 [Nothophytophthora sp. Chile5]|nr:hypothetical protein BBJ28_00009595 [Nothophytophthora sp. Chile5]